MYMMTLRPAGYAPIPFFAYAVSRKKVRGVGMVNVAYVWGRGLRGKKETPCLLWLVIVRTWMFKKCVLVNDDPAVCCLLSIAV